MTAQHALPMLSLAVAPHQSLSIRSLSDGLAFCVREHQSPEVLVTEGFLPWRSEGGAEEDRLAELLYAYEFLSYPYALVRYYTRPLQTVLAPSELVEAGQEALWLLADLEQAPQDTRSEIAYATHELPTGGKSLVASYRRGLWQLLHRSFLVLQILPDSLPALMHRLELGRGRPAGELLVLPGLTELTLLAHRRGELLGFQQVRLLSHQGAETLAQESLFYLFAQWQYLGYDGGVDRVALGQERIPTPGASEERSPILQHLQRLLTPYVADVECFDYPAC